MRWSRLPLLALLLIGMGGVAGCRSKGTVDEAAYVANQRTKLGASVALVADDRIETFDLTGRVPGYFFTLRIGPAIEQTLTKELEASFTSVTRIARPSAEDTVDFYAVPEIRWILTSSTRSIPYFYRLQARLRIVSRQLHTVVSDYRASSEVSFRAGAETQIYGLLGVTDSLRADRFAKDIEAAARSGIDDVVRRIGADMSRDQRLEMVAAIGPVQDNSTPGGAPSPYDKFMDAVVVIKAGDSLGSGFFASKDGMIATCLHVVGGAAPDEAKGTHVEVKDRRGHSFDGEVVDFNRERDLALIKVPGADFPALPLAQTTPTVGREVIAIGTPQGLSWTVSKGIVSALRMLRTAKVVQTDAALAPGSSGGPLIDPASGRVVGIASLVMGVPGGTTANFAIAAEEVEKAFGAKLSGL